jgi:hypothetical protein
MDFILQPWQLFFMILADWVNREQRDAIEYLRTENQVLKEKLGKKRILLSDDHRRRLAVKGKILGRKRLEEIGTLFTPDTILRWHRLLAAKKCDYSARRANTGRPSTEQDIVDLVPRMARENPSWGYRSRATASPITQSLTTHRTFYEKYQGRVSLEGDLLRPALAGECRSSESSSLSSRTQSPRSVPLVQCAVPC